MVSGITGRPGYAAATNMTPNEEFNSVIKVTVSFLALFSLENEPFCCQEEGRKQKRRGGNPTTDMMNLGIMCLNKEWQRGTFLFKGDTHN